MKRFLQMLLAVLFCTTAMCITDINVNASTNTTSTVSKSNSTTDSQNSVQDSSQDNKSAAANIRKSTYSEEEVYLTAQLMHHEAHNQPYKGKIAIAEVVLNRVKSDIFPDTIEDVIFQNGQFTSSRRLRNVSPTSQEVSIANSVLNGKLRVFSNTSVLYFRNPAMCIGLSANNARDWGNLDYYTYIGDHAFYSQFPYRTTFRAKNTTDKTAAGKQLTQNNTVEPADEVVTAAEAITTEMMLAQADPTVINMNLINADEMIAAEGETEELTDDTDPAVLAQKQAKIDAERELRQREALEAENAKANAAAEEEAQKNLTQAVDRAELLLRAGAETLE